MGLMQAQPPGAPLAYGAPARGATTRASGTTTSCPASVRRGASFTPSTSRLATSAGRCRSATRRSWQAAASPAPARRTSAAPSRRGRAGLHRLHQRREIPRLRRGLGSRAVGRAAARQRPRHAHDLSGAAFRRAARRHCRRRRRPVLLDGLRYNRGIRVAMMGAIRAISQSAKFRNRQPSTVNRPNRIANSMTSTLPRLRRRLRGAAAGETGRSAPRHRRRRQRRRARPHRQWRHHAAVVRRERVPLSRVARRLRRAAGVDGERAGPPVDDPERRAVVRPRHRPGRVAARVPVPLRDAAAVG